MTRSRNGAGASSMRPCDSIGRARANRRATPSGEDEVDRDLDVEAPADARLDDDRHERQRDDADRPEPARRRAPPTHWRSSARTSPMMRQVEANTFLWTLRPGAPTPVGGMKRADAA